MRMIQIRHVDKRVDRELEVRAARSGMSLSDYLRRELERLAATPSVEDVLERIDAGEAVEPSESIVEAVRTEREGRGG